MTAESWLERLGDFAVGIVSPKRAALRRHWRRLGRDDDYREAYELALRLRGYKSGAAGKNGTPWLNASNRTADGEILTDLPRMRNRSRALNRDDALAVGITGTFVRGVVGTGLRPQARTGDDAKDDAIEQVWKDRCDRLALGDGGMTHGAHQKLVYGKRHEDGEIFLRPAVAAPGEPLWIESIEAERVCTPSDAKAADPKGRIVAGVEKDRWGRIVAYWVLREHPGEGIARSSADATGKSPLSSSSFDRVDEAWVRHDRSKVSRPGQTRGVPTCAPIMQDLHDLDLLILATLKRTQIAACLAVFLQSGADSSDLIELTAEDYGYQLDQRLEPGMIFRTYPGETVEFLNPTAGLPDLEAFILVLVRRIGAAVGLSPQAILRRWDGVNYSGARTIKIDDRQTFRAERVDFMATLTWEWRLVLEDELLHGNPTLALAGVTAADLAVVDWIGDEEQWVDPQAEATAIETLMRLGLTTYQIECGKLGRDWQENLRQIARELALREELGIPPATLPSPAPGKVLPGQEGAAA